MAQPSWIGSGTTATIGDTRRILLAKYLGSLQNSLGGAAHAGNNPRPDDTIRILRLKILKAKDGL